MRLAVNKYQVYIEKEAGKYCPINYYGYNTLREAEEVATKYCETLKVNVVVRDNKNNLKLSLGYRGGEN